MKSIILSMVAATALLSGCADSKTQPVPESPLTSNDHQITLKIDTVRTDLPDSSPVCLNGMNIYESLSERHPGLFAKNQNVIFRSAFFDDGQAISSETIRKIMQSTPCVESQTTSAGSWEPATELIPRQAISGDTTLAEKDRTAGFTMRIAPEIERGNFHLLLTTTDRYGN
uniref:Lipoprotein n=1 Tax=Escherichia coli TaxID=562 RepID=A0A1U9XHV3_ECOLX|nr:hypothetical protein [Escherichia coli]AQZ21030.1 hypothetical protein 65-3_00066 [Escherichia coli]